MTRGLLVEASSKAPHPVSPGPSDQRPRVGGLWPCQAKQPPPPLSSPYRYRVMMPACLIRVLCCPYIIANKWRSQLPPGLQQWFTRHIHFVHQELLPLKSLLTSSPAGGSLKQGHLVGRLKRAVAVRHAWPFPWRRSSFSWHASTN